MNIIPMRKYYATIEAYLVFSLLLCLCIHFGSVHVCVGVQMHDVLVEAGVGFWGWPVR